MIRPGVGIATTALVLLSLIAPASAVLLRAWERPLSARADRTFAVAEVRISLHGVVVVGGGYYRQVSDTMDDRDSFWGYHVGIWM